MKKLSWFSCITMFFLSAALIIGSFVLNARKVGEDGQVSSFLQTLVYILLGLGVVLFVFTFAVLLIKATRTRIREFTMHCLRFAVIIIAVSVSAFILLDHDFGQQNTASRENELAQLSLAASVRVSQAAGIDEPDMQAISDCVNDLLTDDDIAEGRSVFLTLAPQAPDMEGTTTYVRGSSDIGGEAERAAIACTDCVKTLNYVDTEDKEYRVVTLPVYSTAARCIGALEIREDLNFRSALDLVNFPLIITIAGAVILLIILYCAIMHLVEILLRPRIGDDNGELGGNKAFRLGNESARSLSVFMSMCCTLPLIPIFFDHSDDSVKFLSEKAAWMPEALLPFVPLLVYMLTCLIGNRLGGLMRNKLMPSVIALGGFIAVAGVVLSFVKKDDFLFTLIGIACWGLGYGIASRMCDKYRVYARYSEHGDSAVIYSPYLGLAAGILAGAFLYVRGSSSVLLIASALLMVIVVIFALFLYRSADCSAISKAGDEDFLNEVYTRKHGMGRFGILAVLFSLVLSFGWFGLTVYLWKQGVTATAITFGFACVILGGGVLGNLYRKAETPILRFMFGLSGVVLALSIIPFAISPSQSSATVCYFLMVIAEILGHGTINAYMTQDNIDAGDDGQFGTADDVRTFNTRDRIGYWGQGSLLLEITAIAVVIGGIFLNTMENMTLPLLIVGICVAIFAVFNLVLIVTAKAENNGGSPDFSIPALAAGGRKKREPKPKKEKAPKAPKPPKEKKVKEPKPEKPKKEKPVKEPKPKKEKPAREKKNDEPVVIPEPDFIPDPIPENDRNFDFSGVVVEDDIGQDAGSFSSFAEIPEGMEFPFK